MSDAPALSDNPFRIRAFNRFWVTRLATVLGSQVQGIAIAYQVYEVASRAHGIRQGAFYLGMVGLVQFLPMVVLVLPAGELADRRDRKTIVVACLLADLLCSLALFALSLKGDAPLWTLFVLAALFACSRAYIAPASSSILPRLVPREVLPRAIILNSLAFQSGAIVGPAIGGLLYAVSPALSYGVALATFAVGAAFAFLLPPMEGAPVAAGKSLERMREGVVYVWRNKIVFGAISLDLVAVLLGGATLLIPVYAKDILHVGSAGAGLMRAAQTVGAALVTLYLSRWHIRRHAGLWMFAGVAVFGIATIVFGLSNLFWLTVAALTVLGAADMISVNVRSTLIQLSTPDEMRGRVSSVSMLFISASNELGEFETGIVARFLGPVGAAVFGGVGSLMATGLWALWFPALRKADRIS